MPGKPPVHPPLVGMFTAGQDIVDRKVDECIYPPPPPGLDIVLRLPLHTSRRTSHPACAGSYFISTAEGLSLYIIGQQSNAFATYGLFRAPNQLALHHDSVGYQPSEENINIILAL